MKFNSSLVTVVSPALTVSSFWYFLILLLMINSLFCHWRKITLMSVGSPWTLIGNFFISCESFFSSPHFKILWRVILIAVSSRSEIFWSCGSVSLIYIQYLTVMLLLLVMGKRGEQSLKMMRILPSHKGVLRCLLWLLEYQTTFMNIVNQIISLVNLFIVTSWL